MSTEPETTDPPETPPPLFRGFRARLNKTRRGPFLALIWLILGTVILVSAILLIGIACKSVQ
jgi:hypothetical protein